MTSRSSRPLGLASRRLNSTVSNDHSSPWQKSQRRISNCRGGLWPPAFREFQEECAVTDRAYNRCHGLLVLRGGVVKTVSSVLRINVRRTVLPYVLHAPVHLYRWGFGRLLGSRFLLLSHIGRRTGKCRQVVLEVMEYRAQRPEVVVMSAFGRNANWLRNIEANPDPEVVVGSQRFIAFHRVLDEDEAVRVVRSYEERNWFISPIIRFVLSRFLGWRYRSSDADRRRLVRQLPLIAFWPKTCSSEVRNSSSAK